LDEAEKIIKSVDPSPANLILRTSESVAAAVIQEVGQDGGTVIGRTCITLAKQIDSGRATGSALVAMTRQLQDLLDQIIRSRAPSDEAESTDPIAWLQRQHAARGHG
jgi:hypothetical protein